MIEGIKSLVRYYENLSFISCLLVGLGFHFVERPRGLGITGLLVSLFFFFVVILCLIYRNILMRGATAQFPILLTDPWIDRFIHTNFFLGMIFTVVMMLFLCIPQITSFIPVEYNLTHPYHSVVTFQESLIDMDRIPLLMAFVTSLLISGFMSFSVWFVATKNAHLEKAQTYYLEKQRQKAIENHEEI